MTYLIDKTVTTGCDSCEGNGVIMPSDAPGYSCPECGGSGEFEYTLTQQHGKDAVVIEDTLYIIDQWMRNGAAALLAGTPYSCNPHRTNSNRYDQWNYGHELAAVNANLGKVLSDG